MILRYTTFCSSPSLIHETVTLARRGNNLPGKAKSAICGDTIDTIDTLIH